MKYLFILLVFPCIAATECGKKKKKKNEADTTTTTTPAKDSIPACVRAMIDKAGKQIPPELPEKVDEYIYNGKTAYLVTAQCCDQFNTLYDDSCKAICSPTGGITGRGDRKCEDFSKNATLVKTIWRKGTKSKTSR